MSGATTDEIHDAVESLIPDTLDIDIFMSYLNEDTDRYKNLNIESTLSLMNVVSDGLDYQDEYLSFTNAIQELFSEDRQLSKDEAVDLYEKFKPQVPKGRGGLIGASYDGIKDIQERLITVNNEVYLYIPKSTHCVIHAYQKYCDIIGKEIDLLKNIQNNKSGFRLNNKGISSTIVNKIMKTYGIPILPTFRIWFDKNKKICFNNNMTKSISNQGYFIGHIFLGNSLYHAILVKGNTPYQATKNTVRPLTAEDLTLKIIKEKELVPDFKFTPRPKLKTPYRYLVVYDIETCVTPDESPMNKGEKLYSKYLKMYPVTLGWAFLDLQAEGEPILYYEVLFDEEKPWQDLYYRMFDKANELADELESGTLIFMAHNGGKFDNLFARYLKDINLLKCIKSGNHFKSISLTYKNERELILRDTLPFALASLDKACSTFGVDVCKIKFDIIDKPFQWFVDNKNTPEKLSGYKQTNITEEYNNFIKRTDISKDHLAYLKYDVISLARLVVKMEGMFNKLNLSMTRYTGLAGMAYHVLRTQCFAMKYIKTPDHPTISRFIKDSIYGGRVIQWKTLFPSNNPEERKHHGDKLISIDMNSLYPSSMYMAGFPKGKPFNIKTLDFKEINKKPHYIIECVIEIPNIKYAYHPYKKVVKNNKGEIISYALLYPTNQTIRGVYNDVDIREMIQDGYTIKEVIKGVYWNTSIRVFSSMVKDLYETRAKYKKEGSAIEYIYKIILNSMYGKFNETIKDTTVYGDDQYKSKAGTEKMRDYTLPNGQHEYTIKNFHPQQSKPTHIASYVLAYSRALVNELIRLVKPHNIYYSDTDSLYIPLNIFNKYKTRFGSKYGSSELCGFKNDYGDGVYITKAIFLDLKRYYLKTFNGTDTNYIFKFNGLSFRNVKGVSSFISGKLEGKDYDLIAQKFYDEYYLKDNKWADSSKKGIEMLISSLKKDKHGIHSYDGKALYNISPKTRLQIRLIDDYVDISSLGYDYNSLEYIPESIKIDTMPGVMEAREMMKKEINYEITEKNKTTDVTREMDLFKYADMETNKESYKAVYHRSSNLPLVNVKKEPRLEELMKENNDKVIYCTGSSNREYHNDKKFISSNFYMLDDGKNTIVFREDQDTAGFYYTINGFGCVSKISISHLEYGSMKPIFFVFISDDYTEEAKKNYGNMYLDTQTYRRLLDIESRFQK